MAALGLCRFKTICEGCNAECLAAAGSGPSNLGPNSKDVARNAASDSVVILNKNGDDAEC